MATGDGTEKIGPREEEPVDVNARSGPRVVFPPLNQNGNPPTVASVAPARRQPARNGTLPSSEPRRIKTFSVRGDQPDGAATPVAAQPPAAQSPRPPRAALQRRRRPQLPRARRPRLPMPMPRPPMRRCRCRRRAAQPAQSAPAAEPRARVAATNPVQIAPSGGNGGGGYLVQVASQKNEADAQASYRALQGKYPAVLGSRSPVIKRADLGDKGVYYRAMVGPFGSPDEATQFCGNLKTAGGQCVVQRN